jgi:hypothetical protein
VITRNLVMTSTTEHQWMNLTRHPSPCLVLEERRRKVRRRDFKEQDQNQVEVLTIVMVMVGHT